ncbi:hypothetical protein B5P43_13060 [Bacillus sp. SRB_336]|nr:hypothetical protein B5P43_13060 [Bacillus sp. SRB_336]
MMERTPPPTSPGRPAGWPPRGQQACQPARRHGLPPDFPRALHQALRPAVPPARQPPEAAKRPGPRPGPGRPAAAQPAAP